MIFTSTNQHHFDNFDWELYLSNYETIITITLPIHTKETLWWHFLNIGEPQGFSFFDLRNKTDYLEEYELFDSIQYMNNNPTLWSQGYSSKEQLWWHYLNVEKNPVRRKEMNEQQLFEEQILKTLQLAEEKRQEYIVRSKMIDDDYNETVEKEKVVEKQKVVVVEKEKEKVVEQQKVEEEMVVDVKKKTTWRKFKSLVWKRNKEKEKETEKVK